MSTNGWIQLAGLGQAPLPPRHLAAPPYAFLEHQEAPAAKATYRNSLQELPISPNLLWKCPTSPPCRDITPLFPITNRAKVSAPLVSTLKDGRMPKLWWDCRPLSLGGFGNTLRRARSLARMPYHLAFCTCKAFKVMSFHSCRTHAHLACCDATSVLSYYSPSAHPGGKNVSELLTALKSKLIHDALPYVTLCSSSTSYAILSQ